ncbi:MAG: hypothetical protein V4582_23250 [Pseudomonadota bacterium]
MADEAATSTQRKARLLRESQMHRVGIVHAKAGIAQALRLQTLLRGALEPAAGLVFNRIDAWLAPFGMKPSSLLPLATSAAAFLQRRRLLKPVLVLGMGAALLGKYWRHRPRAVAA